MNASVAVTDTLGVTFSKFPFGAEVKLKWKEADRAKMKQDGDLSSAIENEGRTSNRG